MRMLVIDREALSAQLIRSKMEGIGHVVVEEPVKNSALERLQSEKFDVVFFDPAPLNNARPIVLSIRRVVKNYPYIVLTSTDMEKEEAIRSGANDMLAKPMDASRLNAIVENAERLTTLIRRIGDDSEDFPSAGGVIAKSAFNQLFLSSLDRADRYGEHSYLVFIGLNNYEDILNHDGPQAAQYSAAKLSQYLVRLRRQSDIIAQTGKSEYVLMLQRPQYETEPMEAANRFAEALSKLEDVCYNVQGKVEIFVRLLEVPSGNQQIEHIITHTKS
ncbi:MAG: response regulator [Rhodospirillales bacterium]|nr:response regulator [Rhodospirillales bacterium]